jgi:hypothetical protein
VFDFSIFYIDSTISAFLPVWKPHVDGSKWGATKTTFSQIAHRKADVCDRLLLADSVEKLRKWMRL